MADMTIHRSDKLSLSLTCVDADGDAVDVSGATGLKFGVKQDVADSTYLIELSGVPGDGTFSFGTDGTDGVILVGLTATETKTAFSEATAELEVSWASDRVTAAQFTMTILRDVIVNA